MALNLLSLIVHKEKEMKQKLLHSLLLQESAKISLFILNFGGFPFLWTNFSLLSISREQRLFHAELTDLDAFLWTPPIPALLFLEDKP